MREAEDQIGQHPENAHRSDAGDNLIREKEPLRLQDGDAHSGIRADQFGDDHIGPSDACRDAKRIHDAGDAGWQQDLKEDLPRAGPERIGAVHQVARYALRYACDDKSEGKERTDGDGQEIQHQESW